MDWVLASFGFLCWAAGWGACWAFRRRGNHRTRPPGALGRRLGALASWAGQCGAWAGYALAVTVGATVGIMAGIACGLPLMARIGRVANALLLGGQ